MLASWSARNGDRGPRGEREVAAAEAEPLQIVVGQRFSRRERAGQLRRHRSAMSCWLERRCPRRGRTRISGPSAPGMSTDALPTSQRSPTSSADDDATVTNTVRRPMLVGIVVAPTTTEFSSTAEPVPTSTPAPKEQTIAAWASSDPSPRLAAPMTTAESTSFGRPPPRTGPRRRDRHLVTTNDRAPSTANARSST